MLVPSLEEKAKLLVRDHWGIIFITFLAAAFRFAFFDLTQYDFDYAYPAFQALQILEVGKFPITSLLNPLGLPNPPLMAYIQVLPLLVVRSPLAVQFFITFLNFLAVPLTYLLTFRLFDKQTAWTAAFLYAITPWAVYFSRATWVQGLLPFFTTLLAYLLFTILTGDGKKKARLAAAMVVAGLMAQTYLLAYLVMAQIALLLVVFGNKQNWRPIVMGGIFFILISLPYALAIVSDGQTTSGLDTAVTASWTADGEALGHAFRLVSGAGFAISQNPAQRLVESNLNLLLLVVSWGINFLILLGIGQGLMRLWRRESAMGHLVCWTWFLTPILLMTVHPLPIHPHYLLLTFPAGFILAGVGAQSIWHGVLRMPMAIAGLILIPIYAAVISQSYGLIAQHPNIGRIEWLPLRYSLPLAPTIKEADSEVYIHASPEWLSAVSSTLIEPYQEFEEARFLVLRRDRPALYILLDPKQLSPGFDFSEEMLDKRIDLPNDGSIRFFLFSPHSEQELASLPSHPLNLQLDIGWRLMGYDLSQQASPGDTLELTTYWLVENLPPPRERNSLFLKPFAHLVDQQGQELARGDGHGQAGNLWRRGDFHIDTLQIEIPDHIPARDYWLTTGLYDPNTGIRATFPDGSDYLLLGPVHIQ